MHCSLFHVLLSLILITYHVPMPECFIGLFHHYSLEILLEMICIHSENWALTYLSDMFVEISTLIYLSLDVYFLNGTANYPNRKDSTGATLYAALPVNK